MTDQTMKEKTIDEIAREIVTRRVKEVRQAVLAEVEKIFDSELTIGEIVDEIQSLKEGK